MKLSKSALINTGLALVVIGGGIATYLVVNPISSSAETEATQLTGTVQQGTVSSTISASGSVAAVREVAVSFGASGTIASVDVAVGDTVAAGQQLGTLGTSSLQSSVTSASTALTRAKAELSEAKTALAAAQAAETAAADPVGGAASGSGTQSVSQAKSAVTSAQDKVAEATTALTAAQAELAEATLVSPLAGVVIAINGSVGSASGSSSSAGAGGGESSTTSFVTIADVSQYTMTANIAEADIADVAVGQAASITFPALDGVSTTATVTAISPTATTSNSVVTYATTITLDSIPEGLRLGQTASVAITTVSSAVDALYVATAAITTAADGTSTVDVVGDDGETSTVTVELGVVGDQGTEIVSGLTAGQTIVLGTVIPGATDGTDVNELGGGMTSFPGGGVIMEAPTSGGSFPGGAR